MNGKLQTGVTKALQRPVCYCHTVGHNELYLPARKAYNEITLPCFIENQFIVVKTALGSDSTNLSAFALKWMRSTPSACSASSGVGPGTLRRRLESTNNLNPGQLLLQ